MFENIINIFKKSKKRELLKSSSKEKAKERLHLVLMQDRANVSADFLDLMRQEIIEVIKKYIDIDEKAIDVRLTNETNEDGTQGAPALYANIPIINIKDETRKQSKTNQEFKLNQEPIKKEENSENKQPEEADKEEKNKEEEELPQEETEKETTTENEAQEGLVEEQEENKENKDIEEENNEE